MSLINLTGAKHRPARIFVPQHVGWLDIAVKHISLVQVLDNLHKVVDVSPNLLNLAEQILFDVRVGVPKGRTRARGAISSTSK